MPVIIARPRSLTYIDDAWVLIFCLILGTAIQFYYTPSPTLKLNRRFRRENLRKFKRWLYKRYNSKIVDPDRWHPDRAYRYTKQIWQILSSLRGGGDALIIKVLSECFEKNGEVVELTNRYLANILKR